MKKGITVAVLTITAFISIGVTVWFGARGKGYCAAGDIVSSFHLPPATGEVARISQGLTWNGTHLAYLDVNNQYSGYQPRVYLLTTTGSIYGSFDAPEADPPYHKGLAWDGTYLWISIASEKEIWKITSPPQAPITTENDYPHDITYLDDYLYEVDGALGEVYKINPTTGSTVSSFTGPNVTDENYFGLANDGTYLYIGTYGRNDRIYKYTTAGSQVNSFNAPSDHPLGMAYDGTYLWVVDDETEYFYQIEK